MRLICLVFYKSNLLDSLFQFLHILINLPVNYFTINLSRFDAGVTKHFADISKGKLFRRVTVVANVCLVIWVVSFLSISHRTAISLRYAFVFWLHTIVRNFSFPLYFSMISTNKKIRHNNRIYWLSDQGFPLHYVFRDKLLALVCILKTRNKKIRHINRIYWLSDQGSNLDSSEPKSDVLPITPSDNKKKE